MSTLPRNSLPIAPADGPKRPAKDTAHDPRILDVVALCRSAGACGGQAPLAAMERLASSLSAATDGSAAWTARGELVPVSGSAPELWLNLQVTTDVPLVCQRCLMPVLEALTVDRRLRFVSDEVLAQQLDEELEDDVLALPRRLNLLELIEDELILALPIVPRHGVCPEPLLMPKAAQEDEVETPAPSPFAVLAGWRKPKPDEGTD